MSEKEKRIRSITKLYYSNPKVQEAIFSFSKEREVVPRYFEGFGKRPDTLQYPADIMGLVNKGATSFHASEELWTDALKLNSDLTPGEMSSIRKSWDLLIDIDSPFLDYSKIAAKLIIKELERHGVKSYAVKFSGSKGFHIIVPASAFPEEFQGKKTREMFPEWPRAISSYLMYKIRQAYNKEASKLAINFSALKERTNLSKEDVMQTTCPNCGEKVNEGNVVELKCDKCSNVQFKPNFKVTKRKLHCINETCGGLYEPLSDKELFSCGNCGFSTLNKSEMNARNPVTHSRDAKFSLSGEVKHEVSAEKMASLDLVLVAPRHLFRMPYSLHEKTALASIVLPVEKIDSFVPGEANPLAIKILPFYPQAEKNEGLNLLDSALSWKKVQTNEEEKELKKKYSSYEKTDFSGVTEEMFPKSIKKLLGGLRDGKKRGLFVLITFYRSLGFQPDYINSKIREWNEKNEPPLKEGYIKSQIDWHLKQKKQILPPNYTNDSFYKDLGLVDSNSMPKEKNPIVEVMRLIRRKDR